MLCDVCYSWSEPVFWRNTDLNTHWATAISCYKWSTHAGLWVQVQIWQRQKARPWLYIKLQGSFTDTTTCRTLRSLSTSVQSPWSWDSALFGVNGRQLVFSYHLKSGAQNWWMLVWRLIFLDRSYFNQGAKMKIWWGLIICQIICLLSDVCDNLCSRCIWEHDILD